MLDKKFSISSTKYIFLAMVIFSIFGIFTMSSVVYKGFKETINDATVRKVEGLARSATAYFDTVSTYTKLLTEDPILIANIDNSEKVLNYLRDFPIENLTATQRILISDAKGNLYIYNLKNNKIQQKIDTSSEQYRKIFIEGKQDYMSEIFIDSKTNSRTFIMASSVKNSANKNIGYIGLEMDLSYITAIVEKNLIVGTSFYWVVDSARNLALDDNIINKYNLDETNANSALYTCIKKSKIKDIDYFEFRFSSENYISFTSLIPKTNNWQIGVVIPKKAIYNSVNSSLTVYVGIATLSSVVLLLLTVLVNYIIFLPIKTILQGMQNISAAEADLTKRIENVHKKDELGVLAKMTNSFIANINEMLSKVLEESNKVALSVDYVSDSAQSIFEQSEKTNSKIFGISSSMQEMVATSEDISKNTENAAVQVKQANKDAGVGVITLKDVAQKIDEQAASIRKATIDINSLGQDGKQITAVVEIINTIAEQTNLLALNAAIEAARAGESGKGFAVVADEVRSLAQKTHDGTNQIQSTIQKLDSNINTATQAISNSNLQVLKSVDLSEKTEAVLEEIDIAMQKVENMNMQIATATQQQTQTANELSHILETISNYSQNNQDELHYIVDYADSLNTSSQNIKHLMNKFIIG